MKTYKTSTKLFKLKKLQSNFPKVKISQSDEVANFVRQFYSDDIEIFESAFILLLNQSNTTIGYAKISQGGITGTVIDPLLVAKYSVDSLAKNVILCHNHPSGSLKPSQADLNITRDIKKGLQFLNITLLDHLILTPLSFYSFADNGNL